MSISNHRTDDGFFSGLLKEDRPEKTLFIITTDGMENSSHKYTYEKVKAMVERQKERYGWEFLFLGANIDAVEVAGRFGINANRAANYEHDEAGTKLNYQVLSETVSKMRNSASSMEMSAMLDEEDCLAAIREDHKRRSRR